MSATLSTAHRSQTLPASLHALPVTSSKPKHSQLPSVIPSLVLPRGSQRRATAVADDGAPKWAAGLDYLNGAPRSARSPLTSPRHDVREDAFSLNSFFPSRPGSPSATEPLSWLSPTEETVEEEMEEEEGEGRRKAEGGGNAPLRSLSLTALDEYAKDVIAREDHLGILSLIRIPFFFRTGTGYKDDIDEEEEEDDVLDVPVTPTALGLEEPYDDETLYASLCSRRAAASARLGSVPLPGTEHAADSLGTFSLFSPRAETGEAELGWADALYTKMLGDH